MTPAMFLRRHLRLLVYCAGSVHVLALIGCSDDTHIDNQCPSDSPTIKFPGPLTVTEGGTTMFLLEFASGPPAREFTGILTPEDTTAAQTIPRSFRSSPTEYPIPVTVRGVDDARPEPLNRSTRLSGVIGDCGSDEGNAIFIIGKDVQNVIASNWNIRMLPASTETFAVQLTQAPTATVTVTINVAPQGIIQAMPTSLSLGPSDFNVDHTVTVTSSGEGGAYVGLHPDNGLQAQAVGVTVATGP